MLPKILAFLLLAGGLHNQFRSTGQELKKHPNDYPMSILRSVDFDYLIYANDLVSPENPELCRRNLYVLMDENAFNEGNLRELFSVLSDAFPEPRRFGVTVNTSLAQVRPMGPSRGSEQPEPPNADKHHWARYRRDREDEFFRYIANPPEGKWTTVIIRGKDPAAAQSKR